MAFTLVGALALAMGLLWIGQGFGVVHWPPSSTMVDERKWAVYGVVLAVAGAALIWRARLRR